MKNLIKIFLMMVVIALPSSMVAQDNLDEFEATYNEYKQLKQREQELNNLIKIEEENSYNLRLKWYNTCKSYLIKKQFKAEELQSLIDQTISEIDGEDLYNELKRAKDCFDGGNDYQYKEVPAPVRNSESTTTSPESKGKNNKKKNDEEKESNKKNNNMDKKPSSDKDTPVVSNDTIKNDPATKQEAPIVTDPSKERNGEDKPAAPVVKKDSDNDEKENPVTTPVVSDPQKSNPSKVEKKRDKGEMEEGTSKKSKNSDGSR